MLDPLLPLSLAQLRQLQQRVFDVLFGRQYRQQIEGLKDEPQRACADVRKLVGRLAGYILAVYHHLSACRRVDTAYDVEQGRLATARWSRNGEKNSRLDRERDVGQGLDILFTETVVLTDVFDPNDRHGDSHTVMKTPRGYHS
ncbi:hypothetical protein SDC9_165509 [bioreactor metagenome]|uniref:Uncharacterized protein n=1 Tax=bioreactor metagenome TaxID=1076179 RepID=A0A645FUI0_9ZZZZ